jgi:predicted RNA-binding Zn-ribbon protein involved in translation (DUF1610 family)
MLDDGIADATPNCAVCLTRLEPDDRREVWRCPSCGLVRL